MSWVSKRELLRLERMLKDAHARAADAEKRLHEISLAVLDTKAAQTGYPVSTRLPVEAPPERVETKPQLVERLKREDPVLWAHYQQIAAEAGMTEADAADWLYRQHMGLPLPFEQIEREM